MQTFYLSLGSNLGNRLENLKKAVELLDMQPGIRIRTLSSIYETDPVGFTEQPNFLNMVVGGETNLSPLQLLHVTQQIETGMGRERSIHWGPRTLDIDILTYGQEIISEEGLQIPHPRMLERAFVMVPLAEIAANLPIPLDTRKKCTTPLELLERVKDKSGVRKCKDIVWETESGHFES